MKICTSVVFYFFLILISCKSSYNDPLLSDYSKSSAAETNNIGKITLIDHLRSKPGLDIRGSANSYKILIRGHKSFQGHSDPLFVLDGVVIGRTYRDAANAVDVTQITSITIIPPPRAGRYGSRGQNGVIEIKTRRKIK